MKKILCIAALAVSLSVFAGETSDLRYTGSVTLINDDVCAPQLGHGEATARFDISGLTAAVGTITFKTNGQIPTLTSGLVSTVAQNAGTQVIATTATVDGAYLVTVSASTEVCAVLTTAGSGVIVVGVDVSTAPSSMPSSGSGGSGGSGGSSGFQPNDAGTPLFTESVSGSITHVDNDGGTPLTIVERSSAMAGTVACNLGSSPCTVTTAALDILAANAARTGCLLQATDVVNLYCRRGTAAGAAATSSTFDFILNSSGTSKVGGGTYSCTGGVIWTGAINCISSATSSVSDLAVVETW